MNTAVESPKRIWTEAELEARPENGFIHEVVDGELVMSPKNDFYHGDICSELLTVMRTFVRHHRLGAVLHSSTGFWMTNRNCRATDISFVAGARLKALGFHRSTRRFFPGAPDLAVEILSPNSSRSEMDERLKDFFASGTRVAWIIDPDAQRAEVCYSLTRREFVGSGGFLEGKDLLPGFRYLIDDLFKRGDWE